MSRSYKGIRLKKNRVYSGEDLQAAYKVSANTISNWVMAGLRPSDSKKPYLFRGAVVSAFHEDRRKRSATKLRTGEFRCQACKSAVFPHLKTVSGRVVSNGAHMFSGCCSECGSLVFKISSQADRDYFDSSPNPNTTMDSRHEENGAAPGDVWTKSKTVQEGSGSPNDRIIYKWQSYAGRYDEKTVDRHLAAIRFCEDLNGAKPFEQLSEKDISNVRDHLKRSLSARDETAKSKSTVAHTASHLIAFLTWLLKQDGYKRLPDGLPDYLILPKAVYAASLPRKSKSYPTLREAEGLLTAMPSHSTMDRRARAIFAVAFLGGLRADTIISLRLCHVDEHRRVIIQDGEVVRAKNGKSNLVNWFPIASCFEEEVQDWIASLKALGGQDQDALFPSDTWLTPKSIRAEGRDVIEPMATKHAVTQAFAVACRDCIQKYSPHSVKHTLAAERDRRPLTMSQRKAWSEALGHESEATTERHYGKLSDDQRCELFEEMATDQERQAVALSIEEKTLLMELLKKAGLT